jgi:hypothetical protein
MQSIYIDHGSQACNSGMQWNGHGVAVRFHYGTAHKALYFVSFAISAPKSGRWRSAALSFLGRSDDARGVRTSSPSTVLYTAEPRPNESWHGKPSAARRSTCCLMLSGGLKSELTDTD